MMYLAEASACGACGSSSEGVICTCNAMLGEVEVDERAGVRCGSARLARK